MSSEAARPSGRRAAGRGRGRHGTYRLGQPTLPKGSYPNTLKVSMQIIPDEPRSDPWKRHENIAHFTGARRDLDGNRTTGGSSKYAAAAQSAHRIAPAPA